MLGKIGSCQVNRFSYALASSHSTSKTTEGLLYLCREPVFYAVSLCKQGFWGGGAG